MLPFYSRGHQVLQVPQVPTSTDQYVFNHDGAQRMLCSYAVYASSSKPGV